MSKRRRPRGITKAAPQFAVGKVPATTFTLEQVNALMSQRRPSALDETFTPLPREPQALFGPGIPVQPAPLDQVDPITGRPQPRIWEYPVSSNLPGVTDRLIPWKVLREAAEAPLVRDCIRIRKNMIASLGWDIVVSKRALQQYKKMSPDTSSVSIQKELRTKLNPDTARLLEFWEKPDFKQGETFVEWAGKVLEEHLVLDAVAIYPYRNYGRDRVGLRVIDGSCYSADTEVLTESGWKTFDDVVLSTDRFATRNQKTQAFEWQQATYFHEAGWDSSVDGQCYAVKSRTLDLLVTPNHRMLVSSLPAALGGNSYRKGEVFVAAEDLFRYGSGAQKIPATSTWAGRDLEWFILAGNGVTNSKGVQFSGDDFAAFMGMYLAEGCSPSVDQVYVSQLPSSKGYEPFRNLLKRVFGREVCHTGTNFVISRRVLHDYLKPFGHAHEKYVPMIVKNMSYRQLEIFWKHYHLGDGYTDKARQGIVTSSYVMAGDLQEIAQKLGYSASISTHIATRDTVMSDGRVILKENQRPRYMIRLRTTERQTFTMTKVDYVGKVYCVSVPNETLYVRRNGQPAWCGNTIKPLLDDDGGRPMPPFPAYQQLLWGFPRGEFTADADADGNVIGAFDSDRLIYRRREVRTFSPYGLSSVEQALQDIDLYLRRLDWDKAQYTDGVQPAGWIRNTGMDTWTVPQLTNYNQAFNELYAGQTLSRQRYHLLPPGMEPVESKDHPEKFKPDYHLHLIKLVAMHFDMTVAELGFTEAKGLGSAGYHEGQADVQERKATNPDLRWLQAVLTEISRTHLGMPPELEFVFLGLDSEDEQAADEVYEKQVRSGRITVNESREEMGRAPFDFPEADMPLVETNRGILFLQNASVSAAPGELIQPSQQTDTERESEQNAGQSPTTETTPDTTKAAYGSGDQRAERVTQQLTHDFPNGSLEWARDAKWEGPVQVPLSRLDFSNTDHWVVDPEKISGAQDRIQAGWTKPVILVQTPHRKHLTVVDGHHRSLAYRRLNQPVMAWIGRVNWDSGPWDLMHAKQKAADPEQVKTELAAYSKWCKNGTSTRRPFTFQHLSRADAASHEIDLERVVFAE